MKLSEPGGKTNLVLFAMKLLVDQIDRGETTIDEVREYVDHVQVHEINAFTDELANRAGTPNDPLDDVVLT